MSQMEIDVQSGDLVREGGSFRRVTGYSEIRQHAVVRCRLIRGECRYNETLGVRYFGLVFEPGTPPERVEGELSDTIVGTPGIVSVDDINLEVDGATRVGVLSFDGSMDLGDANTRIPLHDRFAISIRGEEVL